MSGYITDKKTGTPGPHMGSGGAGHMLMGALDSAGAWFPLDSCQQVLTRNAAGQVTQIEATFGTDKWVQTITYGVKDTIGQWVKQ